MASDLAPVRLIVRERRIEVDMEMRPKTEDRSPERFKFSIYMTCQRLMKLRKKRLEDAIDHFSSRNGRLAEPQTA